MIDVMRTRELAMVRLGRFRVTLEWKLADLWIGVFFTRGDVWVCILPCLPIHIAWGERRKR
jgi:hypothetical protein